MARRLIAGGVLAALWLALGLGPYALQLLGGKAAILARMLPSPMRGGFFGLPAGWAVTVHVLAVLLVLLGYILIATWFVRDGRVTFAAGWIAAVLTGFVVGAVLDLGDAVDAVLLLGVRGAISTTGAAALTVFWALVVGWIPALVVSRGKPVEDEVRTARRPPALVAVTVLAAVVALALPIAAQSAQEAAQAQLRSDRQAQAEAQADPDGAAPPDPRASGIPVPSRASSSIPTPDGACTTANTSMLAPDSDAATGHRLQSLQIVNVGESPCTLEGYPDVAFGDQNGHLLDVVVEPGSSFMATDPGPSAVTLAPGETARAAIGWDANSEHGQLAARALWAAPRAGEPRSSWDVALDIIPGTTVHVTAWESGVPAAG